MSVLIIGAGGHGQVVADILLASQIKPLGFLDDNPALQQKTIMGLPVLGSLNRLSSIPHESVIVAMGDNRLRQQLSMSLHDQGECLMTAIHPAAIVSASAKIGTGSVICAGVVVNTGTQLGQGLILNTNCTVDHHNCIGAYAHIGPGANLGGDVEIGQGTLVGIGATVMPQRQVGAWSIVGAGAVVTVNVPARTTTVGVPAQVIKQRLNTN